MRLSTKLPDNDRETVATFLTDQLKDISVANGLYLLGEFISQLNQVIHYLRVPLSSCDLGQLNVAIERSES